MYLLFQMTMVYVQFLFMTTVYNGSVSLLLLLNQTFKSQMPLT